MIAPTRQAIRNTIKEGVRAAITEAVEAHRKAGQSIVVWKNNRIQHLKAKDIPSCRKKNKAC